MEASCLPWALANSARGASLHSARGASLHSARGLRCIWQWQFCRIRLSPCHFLLRANGAGILTQELLYGGSDCRQDAAGVLFVRK